MIFFYRMMNQVCQIDKLFAVFEWSSWCVTNDTNNTPFRFIKLRIDTSSLKNRFKIITSILYIRNNFEIKNFHILHYMRAASLHELTPIIFHMKLTHLGSEASPLSWIKVDYFKVLLKWGTKYYRLWYYRDRISNLLYFIKTFFLIS